MIFWKRPKFPFNYRNKEKWYFEEISESLGNIPASYILFIYYLCIIYVFFVITRLSVELKVSHAQLLTLCFTFLLLLVLLLLINTMQFLISYHQFCWTRE